MLVAIITHNRLETLQQLCQSFYTHVSTTNVNYKLLVVSDGTKLPVELKHTLCEHETMMAISKQARGVVYTKNIAIWLFMHAPQLRKYQKLILLEDDVQIDNLSWMDIYSEMMDDGPYQHYNFLPVQTVTSQQYRCPRADSQYPYGKILSTMRHNDKYTIVHWTDLGGVLMTLNRDMIQQCGGFDAQFQGHGFNHCEYSIRLALNGFSSLPMTWGGHQPLLGWPHIKETEQSLHIDWTIPPTYDAETRAYQTQLSDNWHYFINKVISHNVIRCNTDYQNIGALVQTQDVEVYNA